MNIPVHEVGMHEPEETSFIALHINTAIPWRCVTADGQYLSGEVAHPLTIPLAYNASIKGQKMLLLGTSLKICAHEVVVHVPGEAACMEPQTNFAI